MPLLRLDSVPPHIAGTQLVWLLNNSEKIFPPLNALAMFSNLATSVAGYLYRDSDASLNAKFPYAVGAFLLNAAVTGYALGIMVPQNKKMKETARLLQANKNDEKLGKHLSAQLSVWQKWNLGRGALMLAAAVVNTMGMLEDGSVAKLATF